jgi:hypothetical protein
MVTVMVPSEAPPQLTGVDDMSVITTSPWACNPIIEPARRRSEHMLFLIKFIEALLLKSI